MILLTFLVMYAIMQNKPGYHFLSHLPELIKLLIFYALMCGENFLPPFMMRKDISRQQLMIFLDLPRFTYFHANLNALHFFQHFYYMVCTQFDKKIKTITSDNRGEFFSTSMFDYLASKGIIHFSSCSHTPQQNGVVKKNINIS